jgi:uncharacterized protein
MRKQKDKVIIDTNLWISFLLTKDFAKFDAIIADQKCTLVFSEELIHEIIEVTQRSKFRKYFALNDVEDLLMKLKELAIFIDVTSVVKVCRDIKDNFLLALAIDAKATHLITGDKDLLSLEKFGDTQILSIAEYLEISIQQ